jgi:presenilin 1
MSLFHLISSLSFASLAIDWFTFVFSLYNFAVVGVTAIFYQNGIPPFVTQCYLIASSVIIAWQLSHFDTISTWTLLIMLALYDLCAVLTPCGPLKALVNLMSDEGSPEMPGLLYEAQIPDGLKRPVLRGRNGGDDNNENGDDDNASQSPPSSMCAERYQQPSTNESETQCGARSRTETSSNGADDSSSNDVEMTVKSNGKVPTSNVPTTKSNQATPTATGVIPFAIAKLYRLPLVSRPPFLASTSSRKAKSTSSKQSGNISTSPLLSPDSAEEDQVAPGTNDELTDPEGSQFIILDEEYTPSQLRALVEAVFPKNGAKIVKQPRRVLPGDSKQERYGIIGSDGTLKRILFVEKNGKVFEELDDDDDSESEGRFSNTIKLGLGDFIFYSVLVAKSAQYSFTCFVSSLLVVLAGLGGTLVLLAVYKHALPALPISIALAVVFYVFTRFIIQPWVEVVMSTPFYV